MRRKAALKSLSMVLLLVGMLGISTVIVGYWAPTKQTIENALIKIDTANIPENGSYEFDFLSYKAIAVKEDKMHVFLIPFWNGKHYLPDPVWERPLIPCEKFVSNEDGLYCDSEFYRDEANWTRTGKSNGSWMPDLLKADFEIVGKYLVLNPFTM